VINNVTDYFALPRTILENLAIRNIRKIICKLYDHSLQKLSENMKRKDTLCSKTVGFLKITDSSR
jgi:hypothetical protein